MKKVMEAKDTEITEEQINQLVPGIRKLPKQEYNQRIVLCNAIAIAQAEITWPVAFKAGMEAGMKEVAGWLHSPCPHTGGLEEQQMSVEDCPKCWQAFLKEKGVE